MDISKKDLIESLMMADKLLLQAQGKIEQLAKQDNFDGANIQDIYDAYGLMHNARIFTNPDTKFNS